MEDEEEIVREQRRRNRNRSSSSNINNDLSFSTPNMVELLDDEDQSSNGKRSSIQRLEERQPLPEIKHKVEEEEPQESLGPDDDEEKFLEILRSREKRRQKRQIEILQSIKQEQQNGSTEVPEGLDRSTSEHTQKVKLGRKSNKESDLGTVEQPQKVILGSKGNKVSPSSSADSPQQVKPATQCSKESLPNAVEPSKQVKGDNKCNKASEPVTAKTPQQIKLAAINKKETELNNSERTSQVSCSIIQSKGKAEAQAPEGNITEKAMLSPTSQKTSNEEQSNAGQSCLRMDKVEPSKPAGNVKAAIHSLSTKYSRTATTVRSSSPTRSTSPTKSTSPTTATNPSSTSSSNSTEGGPSSHEQSNNNKAGSHDGSKGHYSTRSQDVASRTDGSKKCSASDRVHRSTSISKPTSLSLSTGVPSSTSSPVAVRPESKAGLTSHAKSSDTSGSTGEHSPTKSISPTGTTSPIGPTSPASPTSPTTSSSTNSPKHTTQVFVSLVKITRAKSTEDTEVNNFSKPFKRRSVEKITKVKAEGDSVRSSIERIEGKEEKAVPRSQARQTPHLQMSSPGEEKKDTERTQMNSASSPEQCTRPEFTASYSTESDSGLRRFTPRTSSFRVISQTEPPPPPFTRSASLRIPSKSFKLDAKLEKYASALQKSESVKSPTRMGMDLFPIPEGVASKRSLFEREASRSGASTPTSRKSNTSLSGDVSSRINQWIKNIQGEASPNSVSTDVKKVDIASKRNLWEQRSLSLDKAYQVPCIIGTAVEFDHQSSMSMIACRTSDKDYALKVCGKGVCNILHPSANASSFSTKRRKTAI